METVSQLWASQQIIKAVWMLQFKLGLPGFSSSLRSSPSTLGCWRSSSWVRALHSFKKKVFLNKNEGYGMRKENCTCWCTWVMCRNTTSVSIVHLLRQQFVFQPLKKEKRRNWCELTCKRAPTPSSWTAAFFWWGETSRPSEGPSINHPPPLETSHLH